MTIGQALTKFYKDNPNHSEVRGKSLEKYLSNCHYEFEIKQKYFLGLSPKTLSQWLQIKL